MRLVSFSVEDMEYMERGLMLALEKWDRASRRQRAPVEAELHTREEYLALYRKIDPVLQLARRSIVTNVALSAPLPAPGPTPSPTPLQGDEGRLVSLCILELGVLRSALWNVRAVADHDLERAQRSKNEEPDYLAYLQEEQQSVARLCQTVEALLKRARKATAMHFAVE